jgi:AraC-like DNA-binding protein
METARLNDMPALLDLAMVEEQRRAAVWSTTAPSLFPGLSVQHATPLPPAGDIRRVEMGSGALWAVRSSAAFVDYLPSSTNDRPLFTVMMQIAGETRIHQRNRSCTLRSGDLVLLDERFAFRLETSDPGEIAFLRMPRDVVLGRNPHLEHLTATRLSGAEAGTSLIGDTLVNAIHTAPFMRAPQRSATLIAMIHLLGAMDSTPSELALGWRVQAAMAFVELHFATPGLRADDVAADQRISRRRLDQLMQEALGESVAGHIAHRRLEQAAADLRDPRSARRNVSEIAFANGFEDAAHFARSFKRRHGVAPLRWRQSADGNAH